MGRRAAAWRRESERAIAMLGSVKAVVLALALTLACVGATVAEDLQPSQFADKLKGYDPATVEAARAYAHTFNLKGLVAQSAPQIAARVSVQLKTKNPTMTDDQVNQFIDAFMKSVLLENSDVIEQAAIVVMLEVFSKDELIALQQFYSSPVGTEVLKKMPSVMGRMSDITQLMQTYIVPRALDSAVSSLRASGVQVKK
ncbi:MAG: DUF2059 domain-containing protein [Bradyrhizobium sp.]|nr:MAG: DUF2059 domain-containing protein [Bradyrhizobium sp.]